MLLFKSEIKEHTDIHTLYEDKDEHTEKYRVIKKKILLYFSVCNTAFINIIRSTQLQNLYLCHVCHMCRKQPQQNRKQHCESLLNVG